MYKERVKHNSFGPLVTESDIQGPPLLLFICPVFNHLYLSALALVLALLRLFIESTAPSSILLALLVWITTLLQCLFQIIPSLWLFLEPQSNLSSFCDNFSYPSYTFYYSLNIAIYASILSPLLNCKPFMEKCGDSSFLTLYYVEMYSMFLLNEWMKESENLSESLTIKRKLPRVFSELFIRFRSMFLEKNANWLCITDGNSFVLWTFSGNFIAWGKPLPGETTIDTVGGIVITIVDRLYNQHKLHCIYELLCFFPQPSEANTVLSALQRWGGDLPKVKSNEPVELGMITQVCFY